MQLNTGISNTTDELTIYVAKLDSLEQKKLLKALKLREAKLLLEKINSKKIAAEITIEEICQTVRKVRKSNAKLHS